MDAKTGANIKTGTLKLGDKNYNFPIYDGTIGPEVIDISKLYAEAGIFTYDPGFTSTGSCESKITYIDGDQGILLYRGYPIDDLAEHGDFLETCYLLLYGELPTASQKADFVDRVIHHTMVHEQMSRFFQGFRRDAHPMAVMVGLVSLLYLSASPWLLAPTRLRTTTVILLSSDVCTLTAPSVSITFRLAPAGKSCSR